MQNFGKIKNVFNNLLVEGIAKKDDSAKKLFKRYIKTIKESNILKTQFLVYNNIENKIDEDVISTNIFVSENIKLLEKFNKADILKENKKLVDLLNAYKSRLSEDYELKGLHESISDLIFTTRTPKNIDKITEDIKNVGKHILTNKSKEVNESIDLPVSVLTKMMVEKYNERYNTLDESDKKILKVLINSSLEEKKTLHSDIVNECVGLIDRLLIGEQGESKEKLSQVKSKLLEDTEINDDNFVVKISKLAELKNNLKGN